MATPPVLTAAAINAKVVFRVGVLLWTGALVVLAVLHFTGTSIPGRYPIICATGIALGTLGYWWAHRVHLIDDDGIADLDAQQ